MFDKLLSILKRGGAVTVEQLARELGTSPAVVSQMIDHLTQAGWLRQVGVSCEGVCSQCIFAHDCQRFGEGRTWEIQIPN
jgi:predicted transcriptional regulator